MKQYLRVCTLALSERSPIIKRVFFSAAFMGLSALCVGQSTTITSPWPATTHLTSGGADAGVPFAIENTNGYPIKVTSLDCAGDYDAQTGVVFQLWYSATSTGPLTTVSAGTGWSELPAGSPVNTTQLAVINVLSNMNLIIPPNTTYRCFVRSSLDLGCKSSPGNGSVSGGGVNLIYNSTTYPASIGFFPGGAWYSPYAFVGAITFEPAINGYNNAGVAAILSPDEEFCGGAADVQVEITNSGQNQISPVTVGWSINGVAQTPYTYTGVLDTLNGTGLQSATVVLGSSVFSGQTDLTVWTTMPNGVNDTIPANDTASISWFAPNPVVDIDDVVLCEGGVGVLSTGSWDQVSWTTGEAVENIIVTEAGVYGVTVTDEYDCTSEDQVLVTVEEDPSAEFSVEEESCGEMVLNAGTSGNTYAWSTGETTQVISVTQTGGYVVTITTAQGCIGVDQTSVTIHSLPNANLGEDFTLCVDYPSFRTLSVTNLGSDYIWSTGETVGSLVVDGAGKSAGATQLYSVTVTDENGCENTGMVTASFEKCVPEAINEVSDKEGFAFYPNPASTLVSIQFINQGRHEIKLMDASGRVLRTETTSDNATSVEFGLGNTAAGTYYLSVKDNTRTYLKPIIIQ